MINRYDIAYGAALGLAAPVWLAIPKARRKVFKALRQRTGDYPARNPSRPAVMIHAVSMGEINATRGLVQKLAELRPGLQFIISTTTDTGYERGRQLYGDRPDTTLIRYPLDFSRAVRRCLDSLRPDVVALMELEVWPNFIRHCAARNIPVMLINGRVTPSSFRNYRLGRPITRAMFRRVAMVCAQDELYAARFAELGAKDVRITGTMKFDSATLANRVEGDGQLAAAMGLTPTERLWVCGSTGPGEEQIVLRVYRKLLTKHTHLRLAIIPRHPERFDEVAGLIQESGFEVVRRSQCQGTEARSHEGTKVGQGMEGASGEQLDPQSKIENRKSKIPFPNPQSAIRNSQSPSPNPQSPPPSLLPPVLLGDTMGELRKFYSLAHVVFVGRTLVDLGHRQHGSDMIEPAALAKPVIVGPYTANFADAMSRFSKSDAIFTVPGEDQLHQCVSVLLSTPAQAQEMGHRAQQVVRESQGATEQHARLILDQLRSHTAAAWPTVIDPE